MTPLPLGSRYQLEERIGEGGLGVVWRGSDVATGAGYAIKVLRSEYAEDPATVTRFVRERTALLRFRHPNVVTLHDMIVEGDRLALVMDLVEDGDLNDYRRRRGGLLDVAEATELMAQVCAALAAAHAAGIVHRDLKPANVLLEAVPPGGTTPPNPPDVQREVRLTDFGLAQVAGEPDVTAEGMFLGTLHYVAPEVIRGGEPTSACDSYAVGVTLYELLVGRPPFTGQTATVLYDHVHTVPERPLTVPEATWDLIAACLDKDPARRPPAAEIGRALREGAWVPEPRVGGETPGWETPGWETSGWETSSGSTVAATARGGPTVERAALADEVIPVVDGCTPSAARVTTVSPAGGASAVGGGGVRGDGPRRRRRSRFGAWAGAALAAVAAVVVIVAFARSAGSSGGDRAQVPLGATQSAAPGESARPGLVASRSAASPGGQPGVSPSSTRPARKPRAGPSTSPGPKGRITPTAGPVPSASRGASPPPLTSPPASPPSTTSATSPAPTQPTDPASPGLTPSALASPSPSTPADTSWQCGAVEAATLLSSGRDTGQTLQACIRIRNGQLELRGVLDGTVKGWKEQVILVLEDDAGNDDGHYYSAVCTAADCTFTQAVTPPSDGEWTVLPEWARKGGDYQSTGDAAGYVDF